MVKKPVLVAVIGDTHTGSNFSPAPQWALGGRQAERLLGNWKEHVALIKRQAKGYDLEVWIGGDLIEGIHHGCGDIWSNKTRDQRNAAAELLLPLANVASAVIVQSGTEVHAGLEGEDDKTVADMLGASIFDPAAYESPLPGRAVEWWHHGPGPSASPWAEQAVLLQAGERRIDYNLRRGRPRPEAVLWHHVHVAPPPLLVGGSTWAAICPCWKLSDEHGKKAAPGREPTIGGLFWWPDQGRLERVVYAQVRPVFPRKPRVTYRR